MIGTIRPSWSALRCLGLRDTVVESMCRTCGSLAASTGNKSRLCLSYDAIFLSIFSSEQEFREHSLRPRPIRCFTKGTPLSADARYLADVSVLTADKKLNDMKRDGEARIHRKIQATMRRLAESASQSLAQTGVPVDAVESSLDAYRHLEISNARDLFASLSKPIADAYGHIFGGLPSRMNSCHDELRTVGQQFGRLTVLVDAVEDADDDAATGSYNIWKASTDLPGDKDTIIARIHQCFDVLRTTSTRISTIAGQYLEAAQEATLQRLALPKAKARLLTHPGSVIAGLNCVEHDCAGNSSLTPTGMCIAALCCIGGVTMCIKDK